MGEQPSSAKLIRSRDLYLSFLSRRMGKSVVRQGRSELNARGVRGWYVEGLDAVDGAFYPLLRALELGKFRKQDGGERKRQSDH